MIYGCYTFKGGTGKSTLALALGTCPDLARRVIVSLDPQMDAILGLGLLSIPENAQRIRQAAGVFDVLLHGRPLPAGASGQLTMPDGTNLVVNSGDLEDVQDMLVLRRLLQGIRTRPIFIDMPPRDSTVVSVGLNACDVVVVPTLLDEFGLAGVMRSVVAVERLVQDRRPVIAVVRNRVSLRPDTAARSVAERLQAFCEKQGITLLSSVIRERAAFRTAQTRHSTLWALDSFYAGDAQDDVRALAAELSTFKEEKA